MYYTREVPMPAMASKQQQFPMQYVPPVTPNSQAARMYPAMEQFAPQDLLGLGVMVDEVDFPQFNNNYTSQGYPQEMSLMDMSGSVHLDSIDNSPATIDMISPIALPHEACTISNDSCSLPENVLSNDEFDILANSTQYIPEQDDIAGLLELDLSVPIIDVPAPTSVSTQTTPTIEFTSPSIPKKKRFSPQKVMKKSLRKSEQSIFSVASQVPRSSKKTKSLSFSECSIKFPIYTSNTYSFVYEKGGEDSGSSSPVEPQHHHFQSTLSTRRLKNMKAGLVEFQLNI
ncbi:hypothetical protein DICA3_B04676 [Diutina catenulata]